MIDLPTLFSDAIEAATALDGVRIPGHATSGPVAIRAEIVVTHDRLPGSAGSTETGIRAARMETCGDHTCPSGPDEHAHPVPNDPTGDAAMRPSTSDADLRMLDESVARFVEMVGELVARSVSGSTVDTWDEAVHLGNLLVQMDAVTSLEQAWGHKDVARWVRRAGDAIHDLEQIHRRHCQREATDWEQSWTSGLADEDCCRVHLRMQPPLREKISARGLCRQCGRLRADLADAMGVAFEDGIDPPVSLLEDFARIGNPSGPDWKRARSDWIKAESKGSAVA